jgi:hypothetical protein
LTFSCRFFCFAGQNPEAQREQAVGDEIVATALFARIVNAEEKNAKQNMSPF